MSGASGDRFYLMEFRNRPVQYGDIGSLLKISGLVVSGGGAAAVLLLPSAVAYKGLDWTFIDLTDEEWSDFIHRSDDPEILVGNAKIFQRKLRWEISGSVQQRIWSKDGFKCVYCGAKMGDALLTIDHWVPLELGGKNDATNYLTSCKRDNKDKGSEHPESWCLRKGYDYHAICEYLRNRKPA
jgi:hypothetical protein